MSPSPVTIPNPTTMLSYQKAVDAGLVDKSYQKVMAKKVEANGDRIGWSPDSEFSRASSEVVRGIGPKYAEALRDMSVFNFATTRGGMGFAGLESIIGKEGVTNLRNLQAALKTCMLVPDEPAQQQVSAARFVELFATDFNGYDVSKMVGPTLVELLNTGIGGKHTEVVEQYASLIAFELLGASLNATEHGVSPDDLGYMVQQAYHGALARLSEADVERVGKRAEALMNQYASYLPEKVQKALGLESTEPTPVSSTMTAEDFMAEFSTNFNGRDVNQTTIEEVMRDLGVVTDPAERKELLDELVAFIGFSTMYGCIAMHESGMPAVEIVAGVDETLGHMGDVCNTAAEGEYVIQEMVKVVETYSPYLPEVVQGALADIMPS